ncbi:MAG: hypothetical protein R3C11_28625 [Planctomycetaceae bacterium]
MEVGAGVTQFQRGDRVAGCFMPGWQAGSMGMAAHSTALGCESEGYWLNI